MAERKIMCEYCGNKSESVNGKCQKCGAPALEAVKDVSKSNPFFYNGYIVYFLHDYSRDVISWQFWLGQVLVDEIQLSSYILRDIVPDGCDPMDYIWKLFELSQGKEEVYRIQEQNKRYPALFEIRRIENVEKQAHINQIRELLNA